MWLARRNNIYYYAQNNQFLVHCCAVKIINKEQEKTLHFNPTRVDSLEKTDAGRDWGQEVKGTTTEDEMAGWHHRLDGREFE